MTPDETLRMAGHAPSLAALSARNEERELKEQRDRARLDSEELDVYWQLRSQGIDHDHLISVLDHARTLR